jgi:hypothetical protein
VKAAKIKLSTVTKALLRGEMLLDSYNQEKVKDARKVRVALAYWRVVRLWFKQTYGWQWTLTSPPKVGMTDEQLRERFGYIEPKKWHYNPNGQVNVTKEELKMIEVLLTT